MRCDLLATTPRPSCCLILYAHLVEDPLPIERRLPLRLLHRGHKEIRDRAHVQLLDGPLQDRVLRLRQHGHGARLARLPLQFVLGEEGGQGLLHHAGEARLAASVLMGMGVGWTWGILNR